MNAMNVTQQGIVTLLRSAITGEALQLPEDFAMENIMELVRSHGMYTLAYDGAVCCGVDRKDPAMQRLFQTYVKSLMKSEAQMREISRIFAAFDGQGIDYMPLKGCNMKARYPKPELRVMGDADILIRMEQYEKILPIMESLGFEAKLESDHELVWQNAGLYVELHKRLIPSYNEDFYAYFGDGWQLGKRREGTRYSMTAEDELVYLFTHFAKHYRDGGIGCRHVVDLWVFLRGNPELDEAAVKAELERLQLLEFYGNIRRLMAVWFEDAPGDEKMDFITDFIFSSGSWGEWECHVVSQSVRNAKAAPVGGRLLYIWRLAFPGVDVLKNKYTVLQKAPWMLPLVWIYRPFYKVFCEWGTLKSRKRDFDVLSPENIRSRQDALNYVGLDYNF